MRRWVINGVATALLLVSDPRRALAEPPWPSDPYDYVVVDQDLRELLQQFGANTGLKLALSDKVQGRVRGPLPSAPPRQFLETLAREFGLEWTYDGAIIAMSSASEAKTEIIPLDGIPFEKLRAELASAGLLDQRYQFRRAMEGHAALVSGPPRYLGLVHAGLAASRPDKPPAPPPDPPPAPLALPALPTPLAPLALPVPAPVAVLPEPAPKPRLLTVMRGATSSIVAFGNEETDAPPYRRTRAASRRQ